MMDKNRKLGLVTGIVLAMATAAPALAQDPDSLAVQRLEHNKVNGAENVETLALLLHQALQNTNFDPLSPHIINKQVYDRMLLMGVLPVQEALVLYTPDEMLFDLQKDFSKVLRDGMALEVSWPSTQIRSISADTASPHNAMIVPVTLSLASPGGLPFLVEFTAARLDGRYYFMPPLFIPNEDLN